MITSTVQNTRKTFFIGHLTGKHDSMILYLTELFRTKPMCNVRCTSRCLLQVQVEEAQTWDLRWKN